MVKKVTLVSYVPLFDGVPRTVMSEEGDSDTMFNEVQKAVDNSPDGCAMTCAWVRYNGSAAPVLVYDDAKQIIDHLMKWSENVPSEWFRVSILEKGGVYAIALTPNIEKSIERWKYAFQLQYGYPPEKDIDFSIIFKPLYFVSGMLNIFDKVRDSISEPFYIGFLDSSSIDLDGKGSDVKPTWLGPFDKANTSYNEYLDSIIDDVLADKSLN
jgi:hypothetical protein